METIQLLLLFLVFISLSTAMFFRKLPALLALPIMAFLISTIAGVSLQDTLELVIGQGATRLSEAYTIAIFGSMLSILLQKTKVAESFIKFGAELSGDNPWILSIVFLILIALLFTTIGGLGAIIMVSTIVLPILVSIGIGHITVVGIFLFGLSLGGILNAGNWAIYINVLKLKVDDVRSFAIIMFAITFLTAIIYITIQLYKDGHDINFKKILSRFLLIVLILTLLFFIVNSFPDEYKNSFLQLLRNVVYIIKYLCGIGLILLFFISFLRLFFSKKNSSIYFTAYFIPIIPLILILLFNLNFISAFIIGLIYGFISTFEVSSNQSKKENLKILISSILEGGSVVIPAVVLMIGIGMLLNAIMGPGGTSLHKYSDSGWPVLNLLKPVLSNIVPQNRLMYIIIFTLLAPFALYRGPLNVWGMGYGIAGIFLASGMNPSAIMGLLLSVGQIQGISDPTNTQNVWLANEMRIDVQKILWNTIPYTWIISLIGLITSSILFF